MCHTLVQRPNDKPLRVLTHLKKCEKLLLTLQQIPATFLVSLYVYAKGVIVIRAISSNRLTNYLMYRIEKFLIKGPFYQIAFITALIGIISLVGGTIMLRVETAETQLSEASWWAFLRMSDPGYLGDDQGTAKRILSTALTISGYVLFVGAFVAILTQWLTRTIKRLEAGFTPISMTDHIVVLGFTNRTATIIRQILWLHQSRLIDANHKKQRKPKIVILSQEVGWDVENQMKQALRGIPGIHHITFRSGLKTNIHDLMRLDIIRAAKIILPAETFSEDDVDHTDTQTIKTLLALEKILTDSREFGVSVVAEVLDVAKGDLCHQVFKESAHIMSSRHIISKIIAQSIFNPGIVKIYQNLLIEMKSESITLLDCRAIAGQTWSSLQEFSNEHNIIGILKRSKDGKLLIKPGVILCPGEDIIIDAEDQLIALTLKKVKIEPSDLSKPHQVKEKISVTAPLKKIRKVLVFGWSLKLRAMLLELQATTDAAISVDIVSVIDLKERKSSKWFPQSSDRFQINHIVADYTEKAEFENLHLGSYDNIIFLASDWLHSAEHADARTIVGYLLTHEQLKYEKHRPALLIELADPGNESLFRFHGDDVLVSPIIISHIIANITINDHVNNILEKIFDPGKTNVVFASAKDLNINQDTKIKDLQQRINREGQILIGTETSNERNINLSLQTDQLFRVQENTRLVILKHNKTQSL